MATTIEITFHNRADGVHMHPGETLRGTVIVFPDKDLDCQHLYVRLLWHTEGRGTRYLAKIEELDVFQGRLQQGFPTSFEFTFVLPDEPWSFEGHYVSVIWKVQAQIDLSWSRDPQGERPFILRPTGVNIEGDYSTTY